jgi:sigma-B regulation protein RsbQ
MMSTLLTRHNILITGNLSAKETLVFAHGFGSQQSAWQFVLPAFEEQYCIILFDLIGNNFLASDNFDIQRYQTLADYAEDLIKIGQLLEFNQVTLIAHSASCMISTIATLKCPNFFKKLIFIGASPHYLDDGDYIGGFTQAETTQMLLAMSQNYANWVRTYTVKAMNNPDQPFLAEEFGQCLLKLRPDIALLVFNMIILSDYRREVAKLELPTLIIQPQDDIFVPPQVGLYLNQVIKNSQIRWLASKGHFPHMSHPSEVIKAISQFL